MKSFIALIFILQSASAQTTEKTEIRAEDIVYNPRGNLPGRFVLSYKDYEDVRLDSNLDGTIDFWHLRKGPLILNTFFTKDGSIKNIYIKKIYKTYTIELNYILQNKKFVLFEAKNRALLDMNWSDYKNVCVLDLNDKKKKLESFSASLNEAVNDDAVRKNLLDPSCEKILGNDYRAFANKVAFAISPDETQGLETCFKSEDFRKNFKLKENKDLTVDWLKTAYELQKKQLSLQSDQHKFVFKCEQTDKPNDSSPAKANENGSITVYKSTSPQANPPFKILQPQIEHELLHRMGITSEKDVHYLEVLCSGDKSLIDQLNSMPTTLEGFGGPVPGAVSDAIKDVNKEKTANTKDIAAKGTTTSLSGSASAKEVTAVSEVARTSTANVPKELTVAQASIPSSQSLSESISNPPPQTDAGYQQAYAKSTSDSNSMLRVANNIIGSANTPANAAPSGQGLAASDPTSSSSREVSSAASKPSSESRSPASAFSGVTSRDKIASDEKVVESITLDGKSGTAPQAAAPAQQANQPRSTQTASRAPAAVSASDREVSAGSTATPQAPSATSNFGFTDSPQPAAVNKPAQSRTPQRTVASQPQNGPSRDEMISFFKNSDYSSVKNKLNDTEFKKHLDAEKITVYDDFGNSFGAKKGDVIYKDQGDRFVRKK